MDDKKYWKAVRAYERKQRQELRRKAVYCTTYCNHAHYVFTGRPIGHQCIVIPPSALHAEIDGDYDRAISIMAKAKRAF